MEGDRSPVADEILAGETEVPWPEATATGSSSGGDSCDRSEVAPVVMMKKAGPWTHVRLSVAMTSGPRPLLSAVSDSWRPWVFYRRFCM
jgi:hypothetical protein